jgi:hypothetical protein
MRNRLLLVLAVCVFAIGAGLAGYFIGASTQSTSAEASAAERASYVAAFQSAKASAYTRSKTAATKSGARAAAKSGRRIGASRGLRAGAKEQASNKAAADAKAAEEAQSRPCVQTDSTSSDCQYLGPGAGYGPCPPGEVPNANGGVVCVKVK